MLKEPEALEKAARHCLATILVSARKASKYANWATYETFKSHILATKSIGYKFETEKYLQLLTQALKL